MAVLVLLVSLAVRVPWAAFATVTPLSDFRGYDRLACRLIESGRFGSPRRLAYRTPGYPGFLAGIYAVFGHNLKAAQLTQGVLGAVTSALIVILAARVLSARGAVIAGLLHAFSPTALAYVPVLASENLAVPILIACLLFVTADSQTVPRRHLAAGTAGLAMGGLLLVRPGALFLLPACLLLAIWRPPRRAWHILPGVTFLFGLAAVLTPWLVRNYAAGLGVGTISSTGGINLWLGNNPGATSGAYMRPPESYDTATELARDRDFRAAAITWIADNPWRYLNLCRVRAARLLGTMPDSWAAKFLWPSSQNDAAITAAFEHARGAPAAKTVLAHSRALQARNLKILERLRHVSAPVALVALLLCVKRWRAFAPVALPALSYVILISMTFVSERFRELSNPLLYVLMAALLSDLLFGTKDLGLRPSRATKLAIAVAAIVASLLAHELNLDSSWYRLQREAPLTALRVQQELTVGGGFGAVIRAQM